METEGKAYFDYKPSAKLYLIITFTKFGLLLDKPVFSHRQLYVVLSRTKKCSAISAKIFQTVLQDVFCGKTVTHNVVFFKAL